MLKESFFGCYGNFSTRSDDSRVIPALNHWTIYPTDFLLLPTIKHVHPCFSVMLQSASTYQKAARIISNPLFQCHAAVPNDLCNWHYHGRAGLQGLLTTLGRRASGKGVKSTLATRLSNFNHIS